MKIVHIEDFILPDAGYQVNILTKLQVDQGHDVHIVTSSLNKAPANLANFFGTENVEKRDLEFKRRTGVKIHRQNVIACISSRVVYYPSVFKVVDNLKPDIIYVHGEDTLIGMQFIVRSLWQKYPMILDCHMLEMASVNRFKNLFRWFFRKTIAPIVVKKNIPLIRTVDTDYVEKCLGIPLSHTDLLSFGSDISLFTPNHERYYTFRNTHSIAEDDLLVIYAGKLDEHKGALFFAESIRKKIHVPGSASVAFLIIGTTSGTYGENVESIFSLSENRILRYNTLPYYDLASYYQVADVSVFPRQCSLSYFDVQATGLPVIMEENEVNLKRAETGSCLLFPPGDTKAFRQNIVNFYSLSKEARSVMKQQSRLQIVDNFNYLDVAKHYTKVLERAVRAFRR